MQRQQPLPESLTLKDALKDEVQVPSNVSLTFKYLIAGPDSRRWKHTIKQNQDTVYAASPSLKKPQKRLDCRFISEQFNRQ